MRSLPLLVVLIAWLPMPAQERPTPERWFDVPIAEVTPLGEWPTGETDWRRWALARQVRPYAVLEGPGEAVVAVEDAGGFADPTAMRQARLLVRTTGDGEVRGRVAVRKPDGSGMVLLPFVLAAGQARPDAEARFLRAQQQVLHDLASERAAGAAWFRHRLDADQRAAGQTVDPVDQATADARRRDGLDDTFQLFTGDRALVENLQFDRPLTVSEAGAPSVALSTIDGITVAAIDWAPLIGDARPELDPLAARIPADQHAVFFPGFAALIAAIDEIDRTGTPVLAAFEPHSEDGLTRETYQRQLCIGLSDLGRRFGAQLVDSVVMTGSDPFLRAGSDVAVLFQAKQPQVLAAYVMAQQTTAAKARPDAVTTDSDIGGLAVHAVTTPDRSLCSYLAVLDDCVVVANSPAQLARLAAVRGGGAALATTGEYRFFRERYRRGADDEVALVVVPDDAIRRWCGPRWRIADSRRIRAAAILTEIDLRHADQLVRGTPVVLDHAALSDLPLDGLGELSWTSTGVRSSLYGTRRFLTPIAELAFEQVGKTEAEAYERFRDRYQDGWRNVFDPIALRVSRRANGLGADLTVMPLILGTDYRQLIEVAGTSTIAPGAGDPHDALIHAVFAVDRHAPPVRDIANFATGMGLRVDPLGWLGSSVAVWADPDPYWDDFVRDADPSTFLERTFYRLPVALRAESNDALKLAAFLTALRAMAEQSAPGMTTWETRTWREQGYVRVGPAAGAREAAGEFAEGALYYAATPDALLVSLNEDVIKRAIDRAKTPPAAAPAPWLGANAALRLEPGVLAMQRALGRSFDGGLADAWTGRSWSNLPILGEWRRRWPDLDPLVVHERLFGTRPLCPGGGTYTWNADWATMASTVYGHPGEPKDGPSLPPALADLARASFGLTFEHDGLRARVELERTPPSK